MGETPTEAPPSAQPESMEETEPEQADARARELNLTGELPEFVEVLVPYGADVYTCPSCEAPIPTRKQINLAKPAKYAHRLNDVMKCPTCSFIFSYKTTVARVIRQ